MLFTIRTPTITSLALDTVHVGLLLSVAAVASPASPLDPGQEILLNGTTLSEMPSLAGTVIADATASFELLPLPPPFSTTPPVFRGDVQESVVRESATGTLDFYYQVMLDPSSQIVAPSFGTEFFGTSDAELTTDVDFLSDSSGAGGPDTSARRLAGRQLITFFIGAPEGIGSPISAGEASREFFIRTDATDFSLGGNLYVDYNGDGFDGSVVTSAFQPVFTPESNAGGLMTAGLCGLGLLFFRKFRIRRTRNLPV